MDLSPTPIATLAHAFGLALDEAAHRLGQLGATAGAVELGPTAPTLLDAGALDARLSPDGSSIWAVAMPLRGRPAGGAILAFPAVASFELVRALLDCDVSLREVPVLFESAVTDVACEILGACLERLALLVDEPVDAGRPCLVYAEAATILASADFGPTERLLHTGIHFEVFGRLAGELDLVLDPDLACVRSRVEAAS